MMREKGASETPTLTSRPASKKLTYLKALLLFLKPYRGRCIVALFTLILGAIMFLGLGIGLKVIIDEGFNPAAPELLDLTLLAMLVGVALLALASFGRTYLVSWIGERMVTDIRQAVFSRLVYQDISFFERLRSGELVTRLTTDTTLVQTLIGTSIAIGVRNILLLGGGLSMMWVISPEMMLYALTLVPIIMVPIIFFGRQVRRFSKAAQDKIGDVGGILEESITGIQTVQANTHEEVDKHFFDQALETSFKAAMNRTLARSNLSCLVMILVFSGVAFVIWQGGQNVMQGTLSAGELTSFIFYTAIVAGAAASYSEIHADLQRAAGAAERLIELLVATPRINSLDTRSRRSLPLPPRGIIAMHGVSFSYPSHRDRKILKDVTFSVAPGEKLALVGPSGAGKSTIFNLLQRFYDPTMGSIHIDGVDIREVDPRDLRSRIGVVSQEPMIFSTTLYENVLYGNPEASEEEVWHAIESAYLAEVVQELPEGLNTLVGTRGVRLSGGQKQRLAIARAILRDPAILLLDEATNSLDAASEEWVQRSLSRLMSSRTTVVIAHRLSTILQADRIVVLDNGQVQAVGNHAELMTQEGLYQRLAMLQFSLEQLRGAVA